MLLPDWLTHEYIEGNEGTLGAISGQIIISGKQAIAEYAAVRAASATTVDALKTSSATFAKVGTLTLGAAAGIGALFGVAIDQAAQFEKKIDYFGAVTNATKADMDAIAQKAIDMSKTTIFSADQMADAMVDFGKAGITTKDILGGVADATADLAQAAGINISDASNIIVSAMDTFHISAGNSISIANELSGAANASIIDVSDLATSLKYAGGVAEAAGIPMNSVVTALALLGNAGIKGSQGGTILRQVMVSLTAPTAAAKKELTALGVEGANGMNLLIDSTGKLKPLDQIFQILKDHTEGLTQAQTLAATKTIFNSRALAGANILLQDGAAGFATMNAQIANTTAADVAAKRLDNLAGDTTKFKNAVQTALIQAGTPLQNMLRGVVQWATKLVDAWGGLSPSTQKLTLEILLGVGAFLAIVGVLSMFIAIILRVILMGRQLYEAFKLVKAGILLIRDGFIMLQLVMEANPLILIITIIVLVVAALIYCWFHFQGFRDVVIGVFKDVKNAALDVWHALQSAFTAVVNAVETAWHSIQSAFNDMLNFFEYIGNLYYTYLVKPYIDAGKAIYNALITAYNSVKNVITSVLNWIDVHWKLLLVILLGPFGYVIDVIVTQFAIIQGAFTQTWAAISSIVSTAWDFIVNIVMTQITFITTLLTTAWNFISGMAQLVWNAIYAFFVYIWNAISSYIINQATEIWTGLTIIWNAISGAAVTAWNAIYAFIAPIVSAIGGAITTAFNAVKNTAQSVWGAISSAISTAYNATINPISSAIQTAVQAISTAINSVGNVWNSIWTWIKTTVNDVWNIIKPILDKMQSALNAVGGAIGKVTGAVGATGNFLGKLGGVFDTGGTIPGAKNSPIPIIAHGGEFMLSNDMLAGRQRIPANILSAITAGQLANNAANNSLLALAAQSASTSGSAVGQPSTAGANSLLTNQSGSVGNDHSVTVENLNNYYPKPEPASDSLPRSIRKTAYLVGGPR